MITTKFIEHVDKFQKKLISLKVIEEWLSNNNKCEIEMKRYV